jgi:predicted transcriptional regulator
MSNETLKYDAEVIVASASRLYRQAKSMVITSSAVGVLIGAVGGPIVFIFATQSRSNLGVIAAVCALIGGLMGYVRGAERAFALKLQAQAALCQVEIEKNTSGHGAR